MTIENYPQTFTCLTETYWWVRRFVIEVAIDTIGGSEWMLLWGECDERCDVIRAGLSHWHLNHTTDIKLAGRRTGTDSQEVWARTRRDREEEELGTREREMGVMERERKKGPNNEQRKTEGREHMEGKETVRKDKNYCEIWGRRRENGEAKHTGGDNGRGGCSCSKHKQYTTRNKDREEWVYVSWVWSVYPKWPTSSSLCPSILQYRTVL